MSIMALINVKDLPKSLKISKEEIKRIRGGYFSDDIRMAKLKGRFQAKDHIIWSELLSYSPRSADFIKEIYSKW